MSQPIPKTTIAPAPRNAAVTRPAMLSASTLSGNDVCNKKDEHLGTVQDIMLPSVDLCFCKPEPVSGGGDSMGRAGRERSRTTSAAAARRGAGGGVQATLRATRDGSGSMR